MPGRSSSRSTYAFCPFCKVQLVFLEKMFSQINMAPVGQLRRKHFDVLTIAVGIVHLQLTRHKQFQKSMTTMTVGQTGISGFPVVRYRFDDAFSRFTFSSVQISHNEEHKVKRANSVTIDVFFVWTYCLFVFILFETQPFSFLKFRYEISGINCTNIR